MSEEKNGIVSETTTLADGFGVTEHTPTPTERMTSTAPTLAPGRTDPATLHREVPDEPKRLPHFHYPIPRTHTGKLQFRTDRGEVVEIDRIGKVHRGGVIQVKREDFARGLIAGGSFANAPADAPLGQAAAFLKPQAPMTDAEVAAMRSETEKVKRTELLEDLQKLKEAGAFNPPRPATPAK